MDGEAMEQDSNGGGNMKAHIHILVWDETVSPSIVRCKYCGETQFIKKNKEGRIVYEQVGKEVRE